MENISLFGKTMCEKSQDKDLFSGGPLDVVRMEFVEAETLRWEDLFSGFDSLRAITYSSAIGFVYQLVDMFEDVEVIFGSEEVLSYCGETGYLRNVGYGGMRGETAGKPLKYAGNGDFRRGTEARIINNLEMRMRRRRSALFSRPRGRTTAAARRGAHIRRIQKSPGNARITAFLRLLDGMSRSAPSRKSQQQTKRTRALRLMLLL